MRDEDSNCNDMYIQIRFAIGRIVVWLGYHKKVKYDTCSNSKKNPKESDYNNGT